MIRFIHSADVHLDSPLLGLAQYAGAPVEEIRGATRRALRNLVDLAIAEDVAFVLVAGDLYDGDWKDYNTGLFFSAQMSKLREADIAVFVVAGNHDAASQISKYLHLPDNVTLLSSRSPDSVPLDDLGVVIHGQSFPSRSVTEDLSASYPEPIRGLFNIGLLHTSVDGREGHEPYAPCSLAGLLSKGYDYWALGHVHKREVLHKDPWVLFPGNIQGRHVRETGAKGCTLVAVEDGQVRFADHRDLDVLRWSVCEVDVSDAAGVEEVIEQVGSAVSNEMDGTGGRSLALRVVLRGPCKAHGELSADEERWTNEIRAVATDASGGEAWIEKVEFRTEPDVDLDVVLREDLPIGGLVQAIRNLETDDRLLSELADGFKDLSAKLPSDVRRSEDPFDPSDMAAIRKSIPDVRHMLLARLLSRGVD